MWSIMPRMEEAVVSEPPRLFKSQYMDGQDWVLEEMENHYIRSRASETVSSSLKP
jgi:hypothetical protein